MKHLHHTIHHAVSCRESRHMIYTRALTGDSVGVLLFVVALILAGLIALMGG